MLRPGEARHRLVGGEHELLDELMALVVLDPFQAVRVAVRIHENFRLWHVEVEAAVRHALAAQPPGDVPERAQP